MIACFERQLSNDWHRIARCIRELTNKNNCTGVTMWKFIDFIVTYRTPLFILLLPLIKYRLLTRYCDNDEEFYYQQQVSEKLQGRNFYHRNLSKGNLLKSLFNELNNLKNNLVTKRIDNNLKSNVPTNLNAGQAGHRLSFAIIPPKSASNLMPSAPNLPQSPEDDGDQKRNLTINASNNSSINILSNTSTPNRMKSLLNRGFSIRSSISSQSSGGGNDSTKTPQRSKGLSFTEKARGLSVRLPSTSRGSGNAAISTGGNLMDKFLRRTSYPYNAPDNHSNQTNSSPPAAKNAAATDSSLEASTTEQTSGGTPSVPNTGNEMLKGNKIFTFEEEDILREKAILNESKITAVSDEQRQDSLQDSLDESSGEPKLHRQKGQSRKIFKNRKSKKKKDESGVKDLD